MRVAFDISPIADPNGVRGIGSYTRNLLDELEKNKSVEVIKFTKKAPSGSDLVHYPYFDFYLKSLPIKKIAPTVVTIHDVIPLVFPDKYPSGKKGKINFFFQKIALKNADAVICDSESSKNDIHEKLNFPLQKISVVYLAASNVFRPYTSGESINKLDKSLSAVLPAKFFLYVGDVNWNKNILGLLKAVETTKINLVMVGKALMDDNLSQTKEINKLIEKLKLEKFITKAGYVGDEELCALYNLAQATIMPSFYEGFGLPVIESMSCKTPVICSNKSSLPEVAGGAGIYFDPGDEKDLVKTIAEFNKMLPSEKKSLEIKITERVGNFSWHKSASRTIEVYKSILS